MPLGTRNPSAPSSGAAARNPSGEGDRGQGRSQQTRELLPAVVGCPVHPEDPAEFFCMDGDSECICAECAVEAAQNGRQVMKVQKAYQSLSGHVDQTLESLRLRSEEQTKVRREAEALKSDLDMIIGKGKQSIQEAFRGLRASLGQKESELLAGIDACEKAASQSLARRAEPAMSHSKALEEAQGLLRKIDPGGEEVKALNAFAMAKVTVGHLVDPLGVSDDGSGLAQLVDNLRAELKEALEQQCGSVVGLGAQVHEIRRSCGPTGAVLGRG